MAESVPLAVVQVPSNLSREVLRWLQSLDLALPIKNPKRDFSNGFLIAEMFSRYHSQDFEMHSYENGQSVNAKKQNWRLLLKCLRRVGLHLVSENEINSIIHCKESTVVAFITRAYELLTQRKVQKVLKRQIPEEAPCYARQTTNAVVGETFKNLSALEVEDLQQTTKVVKDRIQEHEKNLQEERQTNPGRFLPAASESKASQQNVSREISKLKAQAAQIKVTEIHVKQIGGSVDTLRAARDKNYQSAGLRALPISARSGISPRPDQQGVMDPRSTGGLQRLNYEMQSTNRSTHSARTGGSTRGSPRTQTIPDLPSTIDLLNACVEGKWAPSPKAEQKEGQPNQEEPIFAFVTALIEGYVSNDVALDIFQSISQQSDALAEAFLAQPAEFWKFTDALVPILHELTEESHLLMATADLLAKVGEAGRQRDRTAAARLLDDYLLPRLTPIFAHEQSTSQKLYRILEVLLAFISHEPIAHYQMIKQLHVSLGDIIPFLKCMAALIFLETELDENLLDYYLYYAIMGLGYHSPQCRGYALSILTVLAQSRTQWIFSLLPRIQAMALHDSWWEVQAGMLNLGGALLDSIDDWQSNWSVLRPLLETMLGICTPSAAVTVRKVGVSALMRGTSSEPAVCEAVIKVLASLPAAERLGMLGLRDGEVTEVALPGKGGRHQLKEITKSWNALKIVESLENIVRVEELENLDFEYMQILAAAVFSQCEHPTFPAASTEDKQYPLHQEWRAHYDLLRSYIFIALCDPMSCDLAADILRRYAILSSLQQTVLQDTAMMEGIFRLLYPPSNDRAPDLLCQSTFQELLRSLAVKSVAHANMVKQVLIGFLSKRAQDPTVQGMDDVLRDVRAVADKK